MKSSLVISLFNNTNLFEVQRIVVYTKLCTFAARTWLRGTVPLIVWSLSPSHCVTPIRHTSSMYRHLYMHSTNMLFWPSGHRRNVVLYTNKGPKRFQPRQLDLPIFLLLYSSFWSNLRVWRHIDLYSSIFICADILTIAEQKNKINYKIKKQY